MQDRRRWLSGWNCIRDHHRLVDVLGNGMGFGEEAGASASDSFAEIRRFGRLAQVNLVEPAREIEAAIKGNPEALQTTLQELVAGHNDWIEESRRGLDGV